jgi:hypothetical protein
MSIAWFFFILFGIVPSNDTLFVLTALAICASAQCSAISTVIRANLAVFSA